MIFSNKPVIEWIAAENGTDLQTEDFNLIKLKLTMNLLSFGEVLK